MDEHLDDAQRVLERRALRNVRDLVDKLESEDRDPEAANKSWTIAAVAILGVAAVAIVATSAYRPGPRAVVSPPPPASEPRAAVGSPPLVSSAGGAFRILHIGARTGEFEFTSREPIRAREVIEVDAGPGGDLKLAMVKRMAQFIRANYAGDFRWESARLGRVVVLSARPKDNDDLEDFLMKEFFGTSSGAIDLDAAKTSGGK